MLRELLLFAFAFFFVFSLGLMIVMCLGVCTDGCA